MSTANTTPSSASSRIPAWCWARDSPSAVRASSTVRKASSSESKPMRQRGLGAARPNHSAMASPTRQQTSNQPQCAGMPRNRRTPPSTSATPATISTTASTSPARGVNQACSMFRVKPNDASNTPPAACCMPGNLPPNARLVMSSTRASSAADADSVMPMPRGSR